VPDGTPEVVDNQDRRPVIQYDGQPGQNLAAGTAVVVGSQDGRPVIRYEQNGRVDATVAQGLEGPSARK
jgi:hypothetical protein